jgi:glycerophosphoryl diester phosphodiesterase
MCIECGFRMTTRLDRRPDPVMPASGYLPEHTVQAYRLAIDLGVHYVEPDLVMTKDGHLVRRKHRRKHRRHPATRTTVHGDLDWQVCRHDVDLSETTDVASRPEFRSRLRNITLDSVELAPDGSATVVTIEGYFSFDFTLAEIKTLKAIQRLDMRSTTYNGLFEVVL